MASWRTPIFASQLCFGEVVTPQDVMECGQAAAKACRLKIVGEQPGKLILAPGFAGRVGGWRRASVRVAQQMVGAAARTSIPAGSLQQEAAQVSDGIGVVKIKVEIKPDGTDGWEGLVLEVTSCNTILAEEFIAAVGQRVEERFANHPAVHGCKGHLEDFLEVANPGGKRGKVKGNRKVSLHDWYASVRMERLKSEEQEEDEHEAEEPAGHLKSLNDWYNEGIVSTRSSTNTIGRTLTNAPRESFVMQVGHKESFQMQEIRQKVREF